jgi:hypothetical protein
MGIASRVHPARAGALVAVLVALVAAGCSDDEPAGGNGAGGAESGGAGGASSATQGGAGGVTGSGAGGAVTELTVVALESDVTLITALPATVTFLAHVADPDGPADVVGGVLLPLGKGGTFVAVDAEGTWQLARTYGEGEINDGFHVFIARFEDLAGNVAERSVAIEVQSQGCTLRPDYQSCRDCYCEADPQGCQHYTEREYEHLYCGTSYSEACGEFCATHEAGNPDPALIDEICQRCQPSFDDTKAFEESCIADIPECFGFFVDMGNCG